MHDAAHCGVEIRMQLYQDNEKFVHFIKMNH